MKKSIALFAALVSLSANFVLAGTDMRWKLKDGGSDVQIDKDMVMWVSKDGKNVKAEDGEYEVTSEGKEMKVIVKEGKASTK